VLDVEVPHHSKGDDALDDPWRDVARKSIGAVADSVRKLSRCDVLIMTDEELWRPAQEALGAETSDERRRIGDFIREITSSNLISMLRRSARLSIAS
jgi:hypothetical protein